MASTQSVWGMDVGRCALKALKLRAGADGAVDILAHDYFEYAKILTQPDANRHELISNALERFLSGTDVSKDQIVVSVPGQHTLARFIKLPPVTPKRIPDIVRYEADQQIPFDMDDVIWDYQTFSQEDLPDLEVGIFAMKKELLREHLLYFEQAGIEPVVVQSCPLAFYNAAHYDGLLGTDTTVLIDIGAGNTDLVVATQAGLWTRTIPIGGNNFTDALVKAFKLSFAKAEALKRTTETSKYRRQIFQAMRPVFADLVQELQRSIGYYSSTHRDTHIAKVVGAGNAFKLPGLQKYLQQNLGLKVERMDAFKKVARSDAAESESLKEQIYSFSVAYGLALQGLDLSKITCNLLPTEIAKQVVWRKKKPTFAAAAACLVLAGGLVWFRHSADMRALAGPHAGNQLVSEINSLRSQLSELENQGKREREEAEKLVELQRNKTVVPQILQLIYESLPTPDGKLGQAETIDDYLSAVASSPARGERNQVFIESLQLQYERNLNYYLWQPVGEFVPPINPSDTELPGIKIEITCTTPNKGGPRYIRDTFMARLRENGRRPGTGIYVDRVYLIDGAKVQAGPATAAAAPGRGGLGAFAGRPGAPAPTGSAPPPSAGVPADPATLDVVTNEPITDDWRFVVWADVILEDFPGLEDEEETAGEDD